MWCWAGVREESAWIQSLTSWFLADSSQILPNFQHKLSKSHKNRANNWFRRTKIHQQIENEIEPEVESPKLSKSYEICRSWGTTWAIWGAILDPTGFRRGSQNHIFSHKINIKCDKMGSRNASGKTWNFDEKSMPKWEALGSKNKNFAWYLSQNRRFRRVMKFDEI